MQEFIEIYNKNQKNIEIFIKESIYNIGDIKSKSSKNYQQLFKIFPSLELIYIADINSLNQTSPNIFKDKIVEKPIGRNRQYLLDNINLKDEKIAITKPYVSSATAQTCITTIIKLEDCIIFLDFNLQSILKKLGFLEINKNFNLLNKTFYVIVCVLMIALSLFTIFYSLYDFINSILNHTISIEYIFKPIIALTLGLAIFDLAKTVLEQEVLFKSYDKNEKSEYKVLTKFMITIIIALLIEALLVVFKIAIDDYSQMINALYLIIGVGVIIISLSTFIYITKSK
ncbi:hypothetical protein [Aliarcobacter vitoriensis]|uniref:General glycosylation pathway protein n=1 Tax=Aliarcobacter vitoriensis TaxID=2011099 RepID=A0A366MRU2_9BACT|nr:hypothetical protein [Aliarcobacter vitoriensis]RBQ28314.1 hypothetical protein CRU91_10060 [Aliarcobacter vitoriensis]